MSLRGIWVLLALGVGLVSCGGSDEPATTVVKTVTQPTAPSSPAETLPAPVQPPPATATPVANLPDGAVAVQGRFRMRIARLTDNAFAASGDENEQGAVRLWVAETECQDVCRVRLRRELSNGSFERATLEPGDDVRSFGETTKVRGKYCASPEYSKGAATKRLSLRVTASERRAGQRFATRLDGYFSVRQLCQRNKLRIPGRATVVLRGALEQ